jgi:hypothetical protein
VLAGLDVLARRPHVPSAARRAADLRAAVAAGHDVLAGYNRVRVGGHRIAGVDQYERPGGQPPHAGLTGLTDGHCA